MATQRRSHSLWTPQTFSKNTWELCSFIRATAERRANK